MKRLLLAGVLAIAFAGESQACGKKASGDSGERFPRLHQALDKVTHPFRGEASEGCEGSTGSTARITPVRTAIAAVKDELHGRVKSLRCSGCGQ